MTVTAHVDMHFTAHVQLQGQMTSLPDSLPLSSEGLNPPPPRDPSIRSKAGLGSWLLGRKSRLWGCHSRWTLGSPHPRQQASLQPDWGAVTSTILPVTPATPQLPSTSGGSSSEHPLPRGGPSPQLQSHASLCRFGFSAHIDQMHLKSSARDSVALSGPLSSQPLVTEPKGPRFLLLPPTTSSQYQPCQFLTTVAPGSLCFSPHPASEPQTTAVSDCASAGLGPHPRWPGQLKHTDGIHRSCVSDGPATPCTLRMKPEISSLAGAHPFPLQLPGTPTPPKLQVSAPPISGAALPNFSLSQGHLFLLVTSVITGLGLFLQNHEPHKIRAGLLPLPQLWQSALMQSTQQRLIDQVN